MEGTPELETPKKPALSTVLTADRSALDHTAMAEVTAGRPTGFKVDAGLGAVLVENHDLLEAILADPNIESIEF